MDLKEAQRIAVGLASVLEAEAVRLESAQGRVLGRPVVADRDVPGEFRSKWDGYAVDSAGCAGASFEDPVVLDIAGTLTAGAAEPAGWKERPTQPGAVCFRIMTGAVLPAATDAVIPFEDAALEGGRLVLRAAVSPGRGSTPPGADARAGEVLLEEGDILTPSRLALAAALGPDLIHVRRSPRVAVMATGDELRETGQSTAGPVTFCNNIHLLSGIVKCCGAEPVQLGIAADDPKIIFSRLGPVEADMVVTTGGMGKGSRDFIREVWKRLGVRVHFDSLNISPGKGSALGSLNGRIFLGLAGNPWAAQIIFEEIAAPIIRRMLGVRIPGRFCIQAGTARAMKKRTGLYRAFYGRLEMPAGAAARFVPIDPDPRRGRLAQFREGLAYTVLGPEQSVAAEGETVEVRVPDLPLTAWAVFGGRL